MKINHYQTESAKTMILKKGEFQSLMYLGLGLNGEAGEVADKIKKTLRDHKGEMSQEMREELVKELGDVLWYLSQIASHLDVDLSVVAEGNLEKLFSRQKRGKLVGSGDNR